MTPILSITNLHATVEGKEVLKGVTLTINPGEVHAIMGPNGSGKSSLALTLMGHPAYTITQGSIFFNGEDIAKLPAHERAKRGLFLSFQNPSAVPGISIANLTRTAYKQIHSSDAIDIKAFRQKIGETLSALGKDNAFLERSVNDGFSGGEKKLAEVLQLSMLQPKLAILDEVDSGLDIDAMKRIADALKTSFAAQKESENPQSLLLITHYRRLLDQIVPDVIHVFVDGAIERSGGPEVAAELEKSGYMKTESAA